MTTNLRARLQQRRERIATGKPIPDVITMTENFFNPLLIGRSRMCRQCHKRFLPHGKDVMCKECKQSRSGDDE